jgi:hypothetical protein
MTVSSGLITTQAPISGLASAACTDVMKDIWKPSAKPLLTAVVPTTK